MIDIIIDLFIITEAQINYDGIMVKEMDISEPKKRNQGTIPKKILMKACC